MKRMAPILEREKVEMLDIRVRNVLILFLRDVPEVVKEFSDKFQVSKDTMEKWSIGVDTPSPEIRYEVLEEIKEIQKRHRLNIQGKLPISGRKGAFKLACLERRSAFLQKELRNAKGRRENFIKQEISALNWAYNRIILYEELLK